MLLWILCRIRCMFWSGLFVMFLVSGQDQLLDVRLVQVCFSVVLLQIWSVIVVLVFGLMLLIVVLINWLVWLMWLCFVQFIDSVLQIFVGYVLLLMWNWLGGYGLFWCFVSVRLLVVVSVGVSWFLLVFVSSWVWSVMFWLYIVLFIVLNVLQNQI